jgi:glycerol-3-phosphate O-acyltransferase
MFEAQNSMQVVERALKMLGRLTSRRNNMIFGFQGSEALELSIYRNQLLHWFVSESLIAVAVARNLPIPLPRAHHEQHIEVTMEMEEILSNPQSGAFPKSKL